MNISKIKREIVIIAMVFIGPAIAAAGFVGIDQALYQFRDVPLELTLGETELEALEAYFGAGDKISVTPEQTSVDEMAFRKARVHVNSCLYDAPAVLVGLEKTEAGWHAVIEIGGSFVSGTREANLDAAMMFDNICSLDGMVLTVLGSDVPSRVNPMTSAWTQRLLVNAWADFQYKPVPASTRRTTTPAEIKEVRGQVVAMLKPFPAKLIRLEGTESPSVENRWYAVIEIDGWMTAGTDAACWGASHVFHRVCSIPGMVLEVKGEFVPSSVNPMTSEWTSVLVGDEADDAPTESEIMKIVGENEARRREHAI